MTAPVFIDNADRVLIAEPIEPTTDFALPFPVYGAGGFEVTLRGEPNDDWVFVGTFDTSVVPNVCTNGVIRFPDPGVTGKVVISADYAPRRTDQFQSGVGVPARSMNAALNLLWATAREAWSKTNRSLRAGPGETIASLPGAQKRRNKALTFDGSGGPVLDITPSKAEERARAYTDQAIAQLGVIENSQMTTAEAIGDRFVVRVTPDGLRVASSDDPAQANTVAGVSVAPYDEGELGEYRVRGEIINDAWDFEGGPVYVGLAGALTQTLPVFGYVQQIGFAVAPTVVSIDIQPAVQVSGIPDGPEPFAFAPAVTGLAVGKVSSLGVTGGAADETAKFVGKVGLFDLEGKRVRVNAIPVGARGFNGFWSVPHPLVPQFRMNVPARPEDLPMSTTVLQAGPALGIHFQNTLHEWHGEYYALGHALSKLGDASRDAVLDYHTTQGNVWSRSELWSIDDECPSGYVVLSAAAPGGVQFCCRKNSNFSPELATPWRLLRRGLPQRAELPNDAIRVVAGQRNIYIDRSVYDLGAYNGQPVHFTTDPDDEIVRGMLVSNAGWVCTGAFDNFVRFAPLDTGIPVATSSGYGGGNKITFRAEQTDWHEVRFQVGAETNLRLDLALIEMPDILGSPGVIHSMAVDPRKGHNARLTIAFSNRTIDPDFPNYGAGQPTFVRMSSVMNATPFAIGSGVTSSGDVFAELDYAFIWMGAPGPFTEPAMRYAQDSAGNWRLLIAARSGVTTQPPGFAVWNENMGSQPTLTFFVVDGDNPLRATVLPFIIDDTGPRPKIIMFVTESRSPDYPEGYGLVREFLGVADLWTAIDNGGVVGAQAFEWFYVSDSVWQDSSTNDGPDSASVGLPTMAWMPGGVKVLTNTLGDPQGQGASQGGTKLLKFDTRQFTGYTGACDISPEQVQFIDAFACVYQGVGIQPGDTLADIAISGGPRLMARNRVRDDFLGAYDPANGKWFCQVSGDYDFTVTGLQLVGNGGEIRAYLNDDTAGAEFTDPFSDAPACPLIRMTVANGVTEFVPHAVVHAVRCIAGRQYSIRFSAPSTTALIKANRETRITIRRVT